MKVTKLEFLMSLSNKLSGLPQSEIEERLNFYSEMIDDRIEEGFSEEEAVSQIGSVDEIVSQVIADIPIMKIAKEKIKTKRQLKTWEIVLLALGSPIWLALLISAFAVIFAVYVSLWSVIISLWAVEVSLSACSLGGIMSGIILIFTENSLSGALLIGSGIICAGLSIFIFYGCKAITKGLLLLTKRSVISIKNCFINKGDA